MLLAKRSVMSLREEFAGLANAHLLWARTGGREPAERAGRELCRRFGISAPTGYRWLQRYLDAGRDGLEDRSRRPQHSPNQTSPKLEAAVLARRRQHPSWGGRKLAARLRALGHEPVPAPSTITEILRRHGLLDPARAGQPRAHQRFEHDAPNQLWQMDFQGPRPCGAGRCHPLTVLDDHSRYSLVLAACGDERTATVSARLSGSFRRYGLPEVLLVDNGPPWGGGAARHHTPLTVWLLRLGVRVVHSRPRHPQTLGKDERFHRTRRTSPRRSVASTPGGTSTTTSARTRRSRSRRRRAATGRASAPSRRRCRRSSTPPQTTCARSRLVAGSTSAAAACGCRRPSRASGSPCAPSTRTAAGRSTSPASASPSSTSRASGRCNGCLRTPVTHVSGLYKAVPLMDGRVLSRHGGELGHRPGDRAGAGPNGRDGGDARP